MKVLFVNAYKTINPFNWVIALRSGGKYSHCEFIFKDEQMFGASFTDGRVRFEHYMYGNSHEVYNTNLTNEQEYALRGDCSRYQGRRYDYLGLVGFVFKSDDFQHQSKWFCSEIMAYLLMKHANYNPPKAPCRIHPSRLFESLKSQGIIVP